MHLCWVFVIIQLDHLKKRHWIRKLHWQKQILRRCNVIILHSKEQYMQWVGSPLPLYSFLLKLNLVCQYILQSGEFCTCLHSAGILGKLTGCNNQVVTGVDSWPGTVCTGSYSETQHFTSRRVPGSCCFSILEFSGGLTALSRAVGGPCGKNQPTASRTHSGLLCPITLTAIAGAHHSLASC